MRSFSRPGQAMRMSTPFLMASTCGVWPTPPKMTVLRSLRYFCLLYTSLTDLTAQDLLILEDTLEFLADRTASVHAGALPGDWDADAGRYTLTEDSRAAVQALFNVSPTDGQLSSASEP